MDPRLFTNLRAWAYPRSWTISTIRPFSSNLRGNRYRGCAHSAQSMYGISHLDVDLSQYSCYQHNEPRQETVIRGNTANACVLDVEVVDQSWRVFVLRWDSNPSVNIYRVKSLYLNRTKFKGSSIGNGVSTSTWLDYHGFQGIVMRWTSLSHIRNSMIRNIEWWTLDPILEHRSAHAQWGFVIAFAIRRRLWCVETSMQYQRSNIGHSTEKHRYMFWGWLVMETPLDDCPEGASFESRYIDWAYHAVWDGRKDWRSMSHLGNQTT